MMKFPAQAFLFALCVAAGGSAAWAGQATGVLDVKAKIVAECKISNLGTLNFGSIGLTTSNTDTFATFSLQCTKSTTYHIGINAGLLQNEDASPRIMQGETDTLTYDLYRDADRKNQWGKTANQLSGTGTGDAETITVYGRIPAQTAPKPDDYEDFCTIVVTY